MTKAERVMKKAKYGRVQVRVGETRALLTLSLLYVCRKSTDSNYGLDRILREERLRRLRKSHGTD